MVLDLLRARLSSALAARAVPAKRLHRCSVRHGHGKAWHGSVFPFFEAGGEVRAVLCVRYDEPGLFVATYRDGLLETGHPLLPRRVDFLVDDLQELQADAQLTQLTKLWHYDPWWVLSKPPFAAQAATQALKATNCVGDLPRSPKSLLFEPGLGRVHGMTVSEGDHTVTLPWQHSWLPTSPRQESPGNDMRPRRRWVLDPMWGRNSA